MSRNFMNYEWEQEEARKEEAREETKARSAEWMASLKTGKVGGGESIAAPVDGREAPNPVSLCVSCRKRSVTPEDHGICLQCIDSMDDAMNPDYA